MISSRTLSFVAGFYAAVFFLLLVRASHGADLEIPPLRKPPEQCSHPGNKPLPRQVLIPDAACPSGMRWKNLRERME